MEPVIIGHGILRPSLQTDNTIIIIYRYDITLIAFIQHHSPHRSIKYLVWTNQTCNRANMLTKYLNQTFQTGKFYSCRVAHKVFDQQIRRMQPFDRIKYFSRAWVCSDLTQIPPYTLLRRRRRLSQLFAGNYGLLGSLLRSGGGGGKQESERADAKGATDRCCCWWKCWVG